jgi:hypothetical protein
MKKQMIAMVCLLAAWAASSPGAVYVWDNSSADNEWTNALNWTADSGFPGSADTATFNDTMIGTCRISSNITVSILLITNNGGAVNFVIPPGVTFAPISYRQNYWVAKSNMVTMTGGGAFAPTGTMYLAFLSAGAGVGHTAVANMIISNLTFDSSSLANLYVAYNSWSIGTMTASMDLTNATLVYKGASNMLRTSGDLLIGTTYNALSGTLLLPGSVTNIDVGGTFQMGGYNGIGSILDFGVNPAIKSISVSNSFILRKAQFVYNQSGSTVTGFPNQVALTVGNPNSYSAFYAGWYYANYAPVYLTNFSSFNGWIKDLRVCEIDNNGAGTCYATLDLSENSVTNLQGTITPTNMAVTNIIVGGISAGNFYGTLYLPSTLTNIWCNSFDFGRAGALRTGDNTIFLGTNSGPITFTAASTFYSGLGNFKYLTGGGTVTNTGFPPHSKLRIGSPANRAIMKLGYISNQGTSCRFGDGLSDIAMYATNVTIGSGGWANHWHTAVTDFRAATQFVWDVRGDISMGQGIADYVYTYLPANGAVACSNLFMGQTGNATYPGWRALLVLSNTVFTVDTAVSLGETAIITNYVNGMASGLDIGTTNLDIQDPSPTYTDYGRMVIRFESDPIDPTVTYWGLRMKGNALDLIAGLTSAAPQRLSWTTTGLSVPFLNRFGVYYDPALDVTYVGIPKTYAFPGILIMCQ